MKTHHWLICSQIWAAALMSARDTLTLAMSFFMLVTTIIFWWWSRS